jgi:sulfoxide reductase heme-binding subunit YedZ
MRKLLTSPMAKPLVFALALLPFAMAGGRCGFADHAGCQPRRGLDPRRLATGPCASCAWCCSSRRCVLDRLAALARFRRMLGLFVYFYAVLHLLCYGWLDMGFDMADIAARHREASIHPGRVQCDRAA